MLENEVFFSETLKCESKYAFKSKKNSYIVLEEEIFIREFQNQIFSVFFKYLNLLKKYFLRYKTSSKYVC